MIDKAMLFLKGHRKYEEIELDDEQERVIQDIFAAFNETLEHTIPMPTEAEVAAFKSADMRQSLETFLNLKTWARAIAYYKAHDEYGDMGLTEEQELLIDTIFKEFRVTMTVKPEPAPGDRPAAAPRAKRRPRHNGWTIFLKREMLRIKEETKQPGPGDAMRTLMKQISDSWKQLNHEAKEMLKAEAHELNNA
jgi:hypothetical protein